MSTNRIEQRLALLGIHNGRQLAKHLNAPGAIYFLLQSEDSTHNDPRTELHYTEHGAEHVEVFRPTREAGRTISRQRANCVEQAKAWAAENIGLRDWRRTAFTHCWLPEASIEQIRAEVASLEAEQN